MSQMETVYALSNAMSAEIACFEAYVAAQRSFAAAVEARDWTSLADGHRHPGRAGPRHRRRRRATGPRPSSSCAPRPAARPAASIASPSSWPSPSAPSSPISIAGSSWRRCARNSRTPLRETTRRATAISFEPYSRSSSPRRSTACTGNRAGGPARPGRLAPQYAL